MSEEEYSDDDNIYAEEELEKQVEDDEVSAEEEAFMRGYDEAEGEFEDDD